MGSISENTDPESAQGIQLTWENDTAYDKCNPIVIMSDPSGCPITVYKPSQAFSAAWYMIIAFVIVVALLCCVGCICKKLCCKGDEENDEEKKPKEQKQKDEEKPGVEMTNNYAGNSM